MSTNTPLESAWRALQEHRFIKPIAGASVGDVGKIRRWSLVHSAAGATALDVRWEPACVEAALAGRNEARRRLGAEAGHPLVMASICPEGDVHTLKARLDESRCEPCPACETVCPDDALVLPADGGVVQYFYDLCRGCNRCVEVCPTQALSLVTIDEGEFRPRVRETLAAGAEAIEIHASGLPARELDQVLRDIEAEVDEDEVLISICVGSLQKSMAEIQENLEVIRDRRAGRRTMIQADGRTMGSRPGGLIALGVAELVLDARIPQTWVVASGGVTPEAWEILDITGLEVSGFGMGIPSYEVIAEWVRDESQLEDDDRLRAAVAAARTIHRPSSTRDRQPRRRRFHGPTASPFGSSESE